MEEVILDIETDGLLDTVTKVHLIVYRNISTGNLVIAETKEDIKIAFPENNLASLLGQIGWEYCE